MPGDITIQTNMQHVQHEHDLLEIANQVAYEHSLGITWSTWHFWNYYYRRNRRQSTGTSVALRNNATSSAMAEYGSCVDIATQTTASFRSRITAVPGLRHYAPLVQTYSTVGTTDPHHLAHCLTVLFLANFCIVIDPSFTFKAIRIGLDRYVDSLESISIEGHTLQTRLFYREISWGGRSWLALGWEDLHAPGVPHQVNQARWFQPLDLEDDDAIQHINIPIAIDTEIVNGREYPRRKGIKLQAELDTRPDCLPSIRFGPRKYVATVCRVKANFAQHNVTVQIPHYDWLLLPQNRCYYTSLDQMRLLRPVNNAVSNIVLNLNPSRHRYKVDIDVDIVAQVVECLGLERRVFEEVVESVYEMD